LSGGLALRARRYTRPPPLRRVLPLVASASLTCLLVAQSTRPADYAPVCELPPDVRAALEQVEDLSFSFAHPGFYAVLEYLETTGETPGQTRPPIEIDDWTALLERSADLRGLPVTIEGVVGRNKNWRFQQEQHRHLGPVWQLELWRADQPITLTLILTDDAGDIPVGAVIRATGYFVMLRQYYSETKQLRQSALLVAQGPTLVSQTVAHTGRRSISGATLGLVVTVAAALLVVWVLLRRSVGRTRHASQTPRASGPAPISLADDLAVWAAEQPSDESDNETDQT